jgi:hypothetical protein
VRHGEHQAPASAAGQGPSSARDIGALFRRHEQSFLAAHTLWPQQRRALRDISVCRTAALGGHLDVCQSCGLTRPAYNSCRNRHCPKCQALRQARWVQKRMERALPVPHFHVVFTLPAELRPLVAHNRERLFALLFAAAETIVQLAADPKRLGARVGVTAVLHTWGRNLTFHPHLHCIVTAGGLAADGMAWVPADPDYLLPIKVMSRLFRGKFLAAISKMYQQGELVLEGGAAPLADRLAFKRLCDALYDKDWVVYAKASFGNAHALFRYLGQYTHRVAISNHRILSADDQQIVFRTRGRAVCRLEPADFIRRFLQHILPPGFVKIRHFGLFAAGNINTKLAAARCAIDATTGSSAATSNGVAAPAPSSESDVPRDNTDWRDLFRSLTGIDLGRCPVCGGALLVAPLVSARAPPDTS